MRNEYIRTLLKRERLKTTWLTIGFWSALLMAVIAW